MKLRQRLFLRKFLPIWGAIGILFSLVVTIFFGGEGIYKILMMVGINVSCALLSAAIDWKCCLTHHWFNLSLNMSVAFLVIVAIIITSLDGGDGIWTIIWMIYIFLIFLLPCILLIFAVNYLMLRKRLS